ALDGAREAAGEARGAGLAGERDDEEAHGARGVAPAAPGSQPNGTTMTLMAREASRASLRRSSAVLRKG
ncbi:MAG TPA: hypothetical protein VHF22_10795, partial [Planctomycetota bacterium]|nr:hypothetical protein [Planctomycetota bacterium]